MTPSEPFPVYSNQDYKFTLFAASKNAGYRMVASLECTGADGKTSKSFILDTTIFSSSFSWQEIRELVNTGDSTNCRVKINTYGTNGQFLVDDVDFIAVGYNCPGCNIVPQWVMPNDETYTHVTEAPLWTGLDLVARGDDHCGMWNSPVTFTLRSGGLTAPFDSEVYEWGDLFNDKTNSKTAELEAFTFDIDFTGRGDIGDICRDCENEIDDIEGLGDYPYAARLTGEYTLHIRQKGYESICTPSCPPSCGITDCCDSIYECPAYCSLTGNPPYIISEVCNNADPVFTPTSELCVNCPFVCAYYFDLCGDDYKSDYCVAGEVVTLADYCWDIEQNQEQTLCASWCSNINFGG